MSGYPRKSPLTKLMPDSPADSHEMEVMRRRAWIEQGVLMICPSDTRLTDDERNFLFMIAEARYGYGGAK